MLYVPCPPLQPLHPIPPPPLICKNRIVTAFKHFLSACDLFNLTSLIGSIYVEVAESGDDSISATPSLLVNPSTLLYIAAPSVLSIYRL